MDGVKQSPACVPCYCASELPLFSTDMKIDSILIGQYFLFYILGQNANTNNYNQKTCTV